MTEAVTFKMTKNGLSVILDESLDFLTVKKLLKKKLEESEEFFKGAKLKTVIKG